MKGYVIVNEMGHYPLYICLSKQQAEKMKEEIDISCYIIETQVVGSVSEFKLSTTASHHMMAG